MNKYFVDHPEMVLGDIVDGNKLYGKRSGTMVTAHEGADLKTELQEAVSKLSAQISNVKTNEVYKHSIEVDLTNAEKDTYFKDKSGSIGFLDTDGRITEKYEPKQAQNQRISAYIALRDCLQELMTAQEQDKPDTEIHGLQKQLNTLYDNFYETYGLLHSSRNRQILGKDNYYNLSTSLESEFDKDKLTKKSNIFTERTILPHKPVEHVETALEVLTLSMSEKGKVDMEYMQNLTEMTKEELASELKGKIYPVPTREEYQTASEYLSGDIYK